MQQMRTWKYFSAPQSSVFMSGAPLSAISGADLSQLLDSNGCPNRGSRKSGKMPGLLRWWVKVSGQSLSTRQKISVGVIAAVDCCMHRVGTVRVNDDGGWQALAAPNKSLDASGGGVEYMPARIHHPKRAARLGAPVRRRFDTSLARRRCFDAPRWDSKTYLTGSTQPLGVGWRPFASGSIRRIRWRE